MMYRITERGDCSGRPMSMSKALDVKLSNHTVGSPPRNVLNDQDQICWHFISKR